MIYTINYVPDIEEILIHYIRDYLVNEVRFKDIYKNFGNIRISGTHPLAYLTDANLNNSKLPQGLFPSITLVMENDRKNPDLDVPVIIKDFPITSTQIDDIKSNRDQYIISDSDLDYLDTATSGGETLYAQGAKQYRQGSIVMEIWSLNPKVKNRIYDLIVNFVISTLRFTIKDTYSIIINEKSLEGDKSGNYNFDFGKIIYVGILRFTVDYIVSTYRIDDTNQLTLSGVIHTEEEIHNG